MLLDLFFMKWHFWVLCLAGLFLSYIYSRRKLYWLSWQLPGPNPALPLIGNAILLCNKGIMEVLPTLDSIISKYRSGVVRIWLGTKLIIFVGDPGVAYQVNQKTLQKSEEYQYLMKPFLEKGLFNTNDMPYWRRSKKHYLIGLNSENLKSFIPQFHEECFRVIDTFGKYATMQQSVHTSHIFDKFTLSCVAKCTFEFDIHTKHESEIDAFIAAVHSLLEFLQLRLFIPPYRNDFIYTLVGLKAKELKIIKKAWAFLKSILDHHKENLQPSTENSVDTEAKSFIDQLVRGDTFESEEEMLAHMMTMIVGATDTLVTEYTMLLILLAQNPSVQQKVYEELLKVLGDDPYICPTIEDLNNLEYLDRVLKECLRMFPPAPITARNVPEDITVTTDDNKEYVIPQGATVGIFIRNIQNNPLYYENPNMFDPDRWLPENSKKRPPFCYLPFNNGPRNCVGGRYALLQMKTLAATVLRKFEILTSKSCEKFEDIHVKMSMTVRIGPNCQVRFRERRQNIQLMN